MRRFHFYIFFIIVSLLAVIRAGEAQTFSKKYIFKDNSEIQINNLPQNKDFFYLPVTVKTSEDFLFPKQIQLLSINETSGYLNSALEITPFHDSLRFARIVGHPNYDDSNNCLVSARLRTDTTNFPFWTANLFDQSNLKWSKKIPPNYTSEPVMSQKEDISYLTYSTFNPFEPNTIEVFSYTEQGILDDNYSIQTSLPNLSIGVKSINVHEGNTFIFGRVQSDFGAFFKITEDNQLDYLLIDNFVISDAEVLANGKIIVAGWTTEYSSTENSSVFLSDFKVIVLNHSLEIENKIAVKNSSENTGRIFISGFEEDNFLITKRALSGRIHYNLLFDSELNLLKKKGIPYGGESNINGLGETRVATTNRTSSSNFQNNEILVVKNDNNFDSQYCETYDVCVELIDFELQFFDGFEFTLSAGVDTLEDYPFTTSILPPPVIEDYCETVPSPLADFHLPDSICLTDCFIPTEIFNETAESVRWELNGPGTDSTFTEFIEDYCLEFPGVYTLEQTVWFFGCAESYTRSFTVLPKLEAEINSDTLYCSEPPALLQIEASRPLVTYLWQDSSEAPQLQAFQSGNYFVEVSDGYCFTNAEQEITFAFPENFTPVFNTLPDTSYCPNSTESIVVRPESNFSDIFTLNGRSDSIFSINQPGTFIFTALSPTGCEVFDTLQIFTEDCRVNLYLPQAFSPNSDGNNDLWQPYGTDYQALELNIYDRWGNLLLTDSTSTPEWDGTWRGDPMSTGIYVAVLRYKNTKTGKEELATTDITLLR